MDNDTDARRLVRDVIQHVYGDATQTVLDDRAADEIIDALRGVGWATLNEVGAIIAAAGGSVTVPFDLAAEDYEVLRMEDYGIAGIKLKARQPANA